MAEIRNTRAAHFCLLENGHDITLKVYAKHRMLQIKY